LELFAQRKQRIGILAYLIVDLGIIRNHRTETKYLITGVRIEMIKEYGEVTIVGFFPDWLRNPIAQAGTTASRNAIIEAKIQKKLDF
jgi:hypothetical protein